MSTGDGACGAQTPVALQLGALDMSSMLLNHKAEAQHSHPPPSGSATLHSSVSSTMN